MELLSNIKNNELEKELENFIINKDQKIDEIICSMVYEFAKKLPYSMDYLDEDYVPGDFLNLGVPNSDRGLFKWNDSIYKKMIDWGDSLKSGVLLQACLIFQKMLMGEFPNNYELNEEDYYNMGINNMTGSEKYNRDLFEILKELPNYYKKANSVTTQEDRRKALEDMYMNMQDRIGQKVGGFRRSKIINGVETVTEYRPATISWSPYQDLRMVYYFEHIENYGIDCTPLIESLRKNITKELGSSSNKKLS